MAEAAHHEPIGVGVIGLGFMGGTHIRAYQAAAAAGFPCRLAAVSDASAERLSGQAGSAGNMGAGEPIMRLFDPVQVRTYRDAHQLLADPAVRLVSICTYTDSHVDLALAALKAGRHVLVEKPIAASSREVRRLADAARASGLLCMPAMCMRFWPGWDWLHDRIIDRAHGAVRSATFQRLGSQPAWAHAFYGDHARSGGALLDLHIHDADFIHWCFSGASCTVRTAGSPRHMITAYRFGPDSPEHLIAEGAWDLAPAAGFRMRYLVNFERATADFDLARSPQLMLHEADGSHPVELSPLTGYDCEIRHLVTAIARGQRGLTATLDQAVQVMRLLEAERASMESSTTVAVDWDNPRG